MTLVLVRLKDKILGIGRTAACAIPNQIASIRDIGENMGENTRCRGLPVGTSHSQADKVTHEAA